MQQWFYMLTLAHIEQKPPTVAMSIPVVTKAFQYSSGNAVPVPKTHQNARQEPTSKAKRSASQGGDSSALTTQQQL